MSRTQDLSANARDAAAFVDSHTKPPTINTGDRGTIPTFMLLTDEFVALVRATRPPAIYLLEATLDVEAEVASALEEHGLDADKPAGRRVRRAVERLMPHQGDLARV